MNVLLTLPILSCAADDFMFSNTEYGKQIAYGTAGDCLSRAQCPQVGTQSIFSQVDLVSIKTTPEKVTKFTCLKSVGWGYAY